MNTSAEPEEPMGQIIIGNTTEISGDWITILDKT